MSEFDNSAERAKHTELSNDYDKLSDEVDNIHEQIEKADYSPGADKLREDIDQKAAEANAKADERDEHLQDVRQQMANPETNAKVHTEAAVEHHERTGEWPEGYRLADDEGTEKERRDQIGRANAKIREGLEKIKREDSE